MISLHASLYIFLPGKLWGFINEGIFNALGFSYLTGSKEIQVFIKNQGVTTQNCWGIFIFHSAYSVLNICLKHGTEGTKHILMSQNF